MHRFGQRQMTHVHRFVVRPRGCGAGARAGAVFGGPPPCAAAAPPTPNWLPPNDPQVEHTIEENVGALAAQRAAAMDMAAAAPSRGGAAGAEGALTVRNVAALLSTSWAGGGGGT